MARVKKTDSGAASADNAEEKWGDDDTSTALER